MTLSLADAVLIHGLDDWVPLLAVEGLARQLDAHLEARDQKTVVLDAVRELLADELMRVGELAGGAFHEWPGTRCDHMKRIESALAASDAAT